MNWEIFKFIFFLNDDSESTGKTTGAYFQEDVKLFRATANIWCASSDLKKD